MGKGRQDSSAVENIAYKHPITGDPWFPESAAELEAVLKAHFTKAFAAPMPDPESSVPTTTLNWDNIQNWETFRKHCAHHHIPPTRRKDPF